MLAALFALKFAARRCAVHDPEWESRCARVDPGAVHPLRGSEAVVTASWLSTWTRPRGWRCSTLRSPRRRRCHTTPTPATGCCTTRGGQGCRLAYRVPTAGDSPNVSVTPAGWTQHDYREDDLLPGLAAADPAGGGHGSRLPPGNPCSAARWSR